jgi:hypothetical protein
MRTRACRVADMSSVVLETSANERPGPVNNLCVPSRVAPSYAPAGAALVSASVVDAAAADVGAAEFGGAVRCQLEGWFGPQIRSWLSPDTKGESRAGAMKIGIVACARR